ncbi:MAG: 1-(5-phosphoribosyl)-5-[Clostridia bacterium]|nr:1-(5-phosphoribosyl)-5-[(5-phosphoribosylamino)methylideneamino]imidazole-4-carboxamide isomerase [Clostridia bacterium]
MKIYPAIDLYDNKAVRLFKGDYAQMTVYNDDPVAVARDFKAKGATHIHIVDLAGAKIGRPVHSELVRRIAKETGLFIEIGGGIRNMASVDGYLSAGASRVIVGTAAVENEAFLQEALAKYGEKVAVGADVADGKIAVKGWLEKSRYTLDAFLEKMQGLGVKTVVCTDISKDGAMKGANHELYKHIADNFRIEVIASGGVSSIEDIRKLARSGASGAIVGKAYYIGAIDLCEAIEVAK